MRDHVEAVVEVVAELAARDHRLEVAVGRREHAHVHLDRPRSADPLEGLLLQDPQQLHLRALRQVANLVEEQAAAVGQLEPAAMLPVGAGERAALVAEQFGFEEGLGQRGNVHGHERALGSRAGVVDRAGHQLLARAALAPNQDRGPARGRARGGVDGLGHPRVGRLETRQTMARFQLSL